MRYGRQYFREISADGSAFFFPGAGDGVLAYSRVLDTDEVLVVLNLRANTSARFISVDRSLAPPGTELHDLLSPNPGTTVIDVGGRSALPVEIEPHGIALYRRQ